MASQSLAGATQDEVRRHNLGSLLRLLHQRGPTSRSELTALTGLNRSTVGALTAEQDSAARELRAALTRFEHVRPARFDEIARGNLSSKRAKAAKAPQEN